MTWQVHDERTLHETEWVRLALSDVESPTGDRSDHHVVRVPAAAAGVVIDDDERGVLLLWRHRFTTATAGWEIPAGPVADGESPDEAAEREAVEETGWRPGELRHLTTFFPHNGLSDATFHLFLTDHADQVGERQDHTAAQRVEWVSWDNVTAAIRSGEVHDGLSLTALLWVLAFERQQGV